LGRIAPLSKIGLPRARAYWSAADIHHRPLLAQTKAQTPANLQRPKLGRAGNAKGAPFGLRRAVILVVFSRRKRRGI
jgi:hypothetical protein